MTRHLPSRYSVCARPITAQVELLESRQLLSAAPVSTPFAGDPAPAGQLIEAENFDAGGAGVAYKETTPTNLGDAAYRTPESVDVQTGGSNGFTVGYTAAGEWLNYTISVPEAGKYQAMARVSAVAAGASFHLTFDGKINTSGIAISYKKSWTDSHTLTSSAVNLSAGVHVMRVVFDHSASGLKSAGNFDWFQIVETSAPASFKWTSAAAAPVKAFEGLGQMVNGKLYTFGGFSGVSVWGVNDTYQVYDPTTNKWTAPERMPIPETHSGVAVDQANGIIYFVGGFRGNYPGVASSDVYAYDTTADTWEQLPSMPMPVAAGEAALVGDKLHYFGGNRGDDRQTDYGDHWVLDLSDASPDATWQPAAPIPNPRDHMSAIVYNQKIYTFGGEVGHEVLHQQQTSSYVYDPDLDTWTELAPMPVPRSHAESSTFIMNDKIIIAGGQIDDSQSTATMLEYDPATDRWFTLGALPQALQGTVVQPWNNRLIVSNGYDGTTGIPSNKTWIAQWPPVNPPPGTSASYYGTPFATGTRIEAEDFDTGGEGIAYHDSTAAHLGGGTYRASEGVDTQPGGSSGFNIGYTLGGEWLQYTVAVPTAGNFTLLAAVAAAGSGAQFHATFDGTTSTGPVAIGGSSWSSWKTVTSKPVYLTAGTHVMRIILDKNLAGLAAAGNLDWFELMAVGE